MGILRRLRIEPFILAILAAVVVAAFLPATGGAADALDWVTTIGIAFLFFLYGARLEPRELVVGLTHWRLHSVVLASTYLLFPLLGLLGQWLLTPVLGASLAAGFLFGCACAVKWSGVWFLAFFAVLSLFWDRAAWREARVPRPTRVTVRASP